MPRFLHSLTMITASGMLIWWMLFSSMKRQVWFSLCPSALPHQMICGLGTFLRMTSTQFAQHTIPSWNLTIHYSLMPPTMGPVLVTILFGNGFGSLRFRQSSNTFFGGAALHHCPLSIILLSMDYFVLKLGLSFLRMITRQLIFFFYPFAEKVWQLAGFWDLIMQFLQPILQLMDTKIILTQPANIVQFFVVLCCLIWHNRNKIQIWQGEFRTPLYCPFCTLTSTSIPLRVLLA